MCGWSVGRRDVVGRRLIGLRSLGGGTTRRARGKRKGRKVESYGFSGFVLPARRWEKGMTERKVILSVKNGIVGNVIGALFLMTLSAVSIWCAYSVLGNPTGVAFAVMASVVWLGVVGFVVVPNIRKRRVSILGVEAGSLFWSVSEWEGRSRKEVRKALPISTLKTLKVVVRRVESGEDAGALGHADVFVTDCAGKRHELPRSLHPGVYAKKIFEGIREVAPQFKFEEKILGPKD
jgi:hypothetical protein